MLELIKRTVKEFIEISKNKEIQIVSHNDTDGITSAAILTKALSRQGKKFSTKIVKNLDKETINSLPQDKLLIFLDLASNSFEHLSKLKTKIFILDHHEIISSVPNNISIVNPHIVNEEEISGAGVTYLFAKELNKENIDLAHLAVIGMVGDQLEKNPGKLNNEIIKDSKIILKKGLIMYPATRPIDRVLEYCSEIFIPEVTGSSIGTFNFLRNIGMAKKNGRFKSIIELTEEETSKIITSITLQRIDEGDPSELIGNIYLTNFFDNLEDARQVSATINACSRLGESGTAISYCLENKTAKKRVDKIYATYKREIVKALNSVPEFKKIEDKNYLIINAEDKIKDTVIGTVASILSHSRNYQQGKAIIAMAYNENKIKISARMVGKSGKNIREVLNSVIEIIGGEVGGHPAAAGAIIEKHKENEFVEELKKKLEVELIKVK
ncbi:MAG: DHH family phosphoesterase [Nanoarchaeota archaeon]|nr:DHH family phosphoesterase [Nanoarchaeota archaeon]